MVWGSTTALGGAATVAGYWYEFDANRVTMRAWYTCGGPPQWFIAQDMNHVIDIFEHTRCVDSTHIEWDANTFVPFEGRAGSPER